MQDAICHWLCEEMARDDIDATQADMAGNTPLHLAAREGKLSTLSVLLHHGAKPQVKVHSTPYLSNCINTYFRFFQNDMGLKSFDCARLSRKSDCAEFLLLYEASIAISGELISAKSRQEALQSESAELRGHFK